MFLNLGKSHSLIVTVDSFGCSLFRSSRSVPSSKICPFPCFQVVLETEITNKPALRLYENLGFVRDKRLFRYYLNGVDALRLKLWLL